MKNIARILYALFLFTSPAFSQLIIKEGAEGIYLFLDNKALVNTGEIKEINISRAVGREKEFKSIAKVLPISTLQELKNRIGDTELSEIRAINQLKDENQVLDFIKKNPDMTNYGLLNFDIGFLCGMGAVFEDKEAKAFPRNNPIKYKAEFVSSKNVIKEGTVTLGTTPKIEKPTLKTIFESDSSITITWSINAAKAEEALFGEVWMSEKANAPFIKTGTALAHYSEDNKEISFQWRQKTTPQLGYRFFVLPQTLTRLAGPSSDTTKAISSRYDNLSFVNNSKALDTLGGIYITWDELKNHHLLGGIVVERSRDTTGNYVVLDTIPALSKNYFDGKILPNTHYNYRFKTLDVEGTLSGGAAYVTGVFTPKMLALEAPTEVKIKSTKDGFPRISWSPVPSAEVSGYQVFRSSELSPGFTLVSNLIQDSVFVDTTVHNSRITYKYAVKTLNYENRTSLMSMEVLGSNQNKILPKTPYDVETYAEPGKATLRWKDMSSFDEYTLGYQIYKKTVNLNDKNSEEELSVSQLKARGFVKITPEIFVETIFTDTEVKPGTVYQYAVTAIDLFGVEGKSLGAYRVVVPTFNYKSPEIYVRNTSKGIQITWTDAAISEISNYIVFRRGPNQASPIKIGSVKRGQENFTDSNVKSGELYFYSIKMETSSGLITQAGLEKSVRKQ
jgi:hypothetical protein